MWFDDGRAAVARISHYYCWSVVQTQARGTTMARLHYTWPSREGNLTVAQQLFEVRC